VIRFVPELTAKGADVARDPVAVDLRFGEAKCGSQLAVGDDLARTGDERVQNDVLGRRKPYLTRAQLNAWSERIDLEIGDRQRSNGTYHVSSVAWQRNYYRVEGAAGA